MIVPLLPQLSSTYRLFQGHSLHVEYTCRSITHPPNIISGMGQGGNFLRMMGLSFSLYITSYQYFILLTLEVAGYGSGFRELVNSDL